jgi:hypothetical protein
MEPPSTAAAVLVDLIPNLSILCSLYSAAHGSHRISSALDSALRLSPKFRYRYSNTLHRILDVKNRKSTVNFCRISTCDGGTRQEQRAGSYVSPSLEREVIRVMERETGIEPATSSLGSWRSTAELLPLTGTSRITVPEQHTWSRIVPDALHQGDTNYHPSGTHLQGMCVPPAITLGGSPLSQQGRSRGPFACNFPMIDESHLCDVATREQL